MTTCHFSSKFLFLAKNNMPDPHQSVKRLFCRQSEQDRHAVNRLIQFRHQTENVASPPKGSQVAAQKMQGPLAIRTPAKEETQEALLLTRILKAP